MSDRQDTRPPPEADARRDAAATAMLSAPAEPARPAVDALFRVLEEAERIWAPVSALHAAADAEATAAGITIGSAEKANLPAWQAYSSAWAKTAPRIDELCVLAEPFMEQPAETLDDLVLKHRISLTLDQYEGAAVTDLDRLAKAWSPAPRVPVPPFPAAAEVSLAHMVVDPRLNCDIALRDRARAILAAEDASAPDPIFAAIEKAHALHAVERAAHAVCGELPDAAPEWEPHDAAYRAWFDHVDNVLMATVPTTAAGCVSLARFAVDFCAEEGVPLSQATEADEVDNIVPLRLIAQSAAAGGAPPADRDWNAFAATHPGFMPVPANKPTCLASLEAAIPSEARRLLDLARAELARREACFVGHPDPTVWPRVAATLRREMRMDLLELVAADLPAEQDPAEADTALSRAIRAHQAAYDVFAAACPAIDPVAVREAGGDDSEEAMAPAWETWHATNDIAFQAWRDLFQHQPASLGDLLALLRHVEKHIEGHIGMEAEPDVFGYLVESVAGLIPVAAPPARDTAGPDPIFDALNACRAPEAEMEAFHALHSRGKTGPGYTAEREMALYGTAAAAWNAVFATMPTTQGGRAALLAFIERRIEEESSPGGPPPDGEGSLFDRAYRALARIIRAERIETGFDLSKLTTLQLSNYHDAFEASAVSWLYISNAGWAEDADGIAEAEYDRHARMRSAIADEMRLRAPADDWDCDVRLAALIRDEMLCNGSLRHAPALRAAIAQRWGAAA